MWKQVAHKLRQVNDLFEVMEIRCLVIKLRTV